MDRTFSSSRPVVVGISALAAALALSACGGGDTAATHSTQSTTSGTTSSTGVASGTATAAKGPHNQADIAFATSMIPHHRQAISMSDLAATRSSSQKVKALALQIKAAQAPEIERMSGWLTGWGAPVPTANGMGSMDMSGGDDMGGLMSDQDMADLAAKQDVSFDKAFLSGMVAHHRGAVEMGKTELSQGQNAEAKELAKSVVDSQSKEIEEMTALLAELPG